MTGAAPADYAAMAVGSVIAGVVLLVGWAAWLWVRDRWRGHRKRPMEGAGGGTVIEMKARRPR